MRPDVRAYRPSLPERLLRSSLGFGGGVAREIGGVVLPANLRRTRVYQNLVDATLRFLVEQVGGATALRDHYRTTLEEVPHAGFATYAARQLGPYVRAAVGQFAPERVTLTERFLERSAGSARDASREGAS